MLPKWCVELCEDMAYITYLVLFLVNFEGNKKVFSLGKIFLSDEKIIPF